MNDAPLAARRRDVQNILEPRTLQDRETKACLNRAHAARAAPKTLLQRAFGRPLPALAASQLKYVNDAEER